MIVLEILLVILGILIIVPGVLFWVYFFRDRKKIRDKIERVKKHPEEKVQSVAVYKKYDPKTKTFEYEIRYDK